MAQAFTYTLLTYKPHSTHMHADKQTDRYRQTDRQTHIHTWEQTDRHIYTTLHTDI